MNEIEAAVLQVEREIGGKLPQVHAVFLIRNSGDIRGDSLLLYRAADLSERNAAAHVQRFAPGWLAVGDDSGGRLVMIQLDDSDARPLLVDAGALGFPAMMRELGKTWREWEELGFPIPED